MERVQYLVSLRYFNLFEWELFTPKGTMPAGQIRIARGGGPQNFFSCVQEIVLRGRRGKWAKATAEEVEEEMRKGTPYCYRFRVPLGRDVVVRDIVRGEVRFNTGAVGDFVILRSNGLPVYNFCVAIDDALMKVTHVLRAEEHLPNTLRQVRSPRSRSVPHGGAPSPVLLFGGTASASQCLGVLALPPLCFCMRYSVCTASSRLAFPCVSLVAVAHAVTHLHHFRLKLFPARLAIVKWNAFHFELS
jgi:tRNA synthetases class I (E and Q), catalytic domain